MTVFKRLVNMARPYIGRFLLAAVCMTAAGALHSSLPLVAKEAIDGIFMNKDISALKWIPFAIVGIFLLKNLCNYVQVILMNSIGLRIVTDLRRKLYERIQMQSLSFFTEHPTGL